MTTFSFHPAAAEYDPLNALTLGKVADLTTGDEAAVLSGLSAWGFPASRARFLDRRGTQGFVAATDKMVLLAFRGTEVTRLEDLKTDAMIRLVAGPGGQGQAHHGFTQGLDAVWDEVTEALETFRDRGQPLWITGHSLGAALATLAAARCHFELGVTPQGLYTYGSPRVGDSAFAAAFDRALKGQTFRFRNNNDVVTRVPVPGLFWLRYRHVGNLRYFDRHGGMRTGMSSAELLLDRLRGRLDDLGDAGSDGLKDHALARYLEHLAANRGAL